MDKDKIFISLIILIGSVIGAGIFLYISYIMWHFFMMRF